MPLIKRMLQIIITHRRVDGLHRRQIKLKEFIQILPIRVHHERRQIKIKNFSFPQIGTKSYRKMILRPHLRLMITIQFLFKIL